jgi:hypothetical protein
MLPRSKIKKIIINNRSLLKKYSVERLGIFGSYLKGRGKIRRDIDLLVEFKEPIDLFRFVHLKEDLERLIKIKVDLATPKALKPYIKDKILREVDWIERI